MTWAELARGIQSLKLEHGDRIVAIIMGDGRRIVVQSIEWIKEMDGAVSPALWAKEEKR